MSSIFNNDFAIQLEQLEANFTTDLPSTTTDANSLNDGIDHASLQEYLQSGDLIVNDNGPIALAAPLHNQGPYDTHGAEGFPSGTCNMAMLELYQPLPVPTGTLFGLGNSSTTQGASQADFGAGSSLHNDFGPGWVPDCSGILLPDLNSGLPEGQPDRDFSGSFAPSKQSRVAPLRQAGDQPLAGPGSLQAGRQSTEISPRAISWERRKGQYFCLHTGCRNTQFKRLRDLERHQNNIHSQTTFFWCRHDGCGRSRPFPRKDKRNDHERKVHHVSYSTAENH